MFYGRSFVDLISAIAFISRCQKPGFLAKKFALVITHSPQKPGFSTLLANFLDIFFPIFAIKGNNLKLRKQISIETAEIYRKAIGMRSRTIKRVNPTIFTKQVFRLSRIELIGL
jgi:hypothetical protein